MSEDKSQDQGSDAEGGGQQPGQTPRTFTQEQMDATIRDRLARKDQQYADYDDLKRQAEKWAAHEEAQKSELQKLTEAKEAAERKGQDALATANERLIKAEFIAAAAALDVANPQDAYLLADRAGVAVADDGAITGVQPAVQALVDAGRLPLRTKAKAPSLDGGAGSGAREGDVVSLSPQEESVAKKMGLTPEQYQKAKKEAELMRK